VTPVTFSLTPARYFYRVIIYDMQNNSAIKKLLALALLLFPLLCILGFLLHFHSLHGFFHFTWARPPYNAERLFDALVSGRGHGFFIAHIIVYAAVPFLLVTVLVLSWYLFPHSPWAAVLGAILGVLGSLALAGVVSSWLSFAAVGKVHPEFYDGARAALVELTNMQGILQWNSIGSYCIFAGLIILAAGLLVNRQFPRWSMICIILGSLLFFFFMDMDNWMLIATILLGIGLLPFITRLWQEK
jgi:hypothetical protein